jgi:NitT/TauT family transport system substrate-binding protein
MICWAALALAAGGAAKLVVAQAPALRVATVMNDDTTPVYYAYRTRMFAKAGIDVTLSSLANGSAIATAIAGGSFDVGKGALATVLTARSKGIPLVLVAPGGMYTEKAGKAPVSVLIQAVDTNLRTGKDLEGKTIGVDSLNSIGALMIEVWIDQNGGDSTKVKFVEIPSVAGAAAIAAHRIDAHQMIDPYLTQALMSGTTKLLAPTMSVMGTNYLVGAWYAMTEWAEQHAGLVKAFAKVLSDAAAFTNAHHGVTESMMAEATKIPIEVFSKMERMYTPTSLTPSAVQPVIDFMAKYNWIPRTFPAKDVIFGA